MARRRGRRGRRAPEASNHERWLVSYADFITLLFAFFTTLYAISTVDQKKAGSLVYSMRSAFSTAFFPADKPQDGAGAAGTHPAPVVAMDGGGGKPDSDGAAAAAVARFDDVAARLEELARDPKVAGRISVRVEARGVVVSLAEAAFFESGDAHMRSSAAGALGLVAQHLQSSGLDMIIEGHTDNVRVTPGSRYDSNWELSTARATAVLAILVESHGLDPRRLSAAGYGEHRPVASNATVDGRARNRRVDVVVKRPEAISGATPAP
jgi:chemotaxis protein MotB